MAKWIDACSESEFPAHGKTCMEVAGIALVLCKIDGTYFAAANICPHAGMPLGDGDMNGPVITCPYHGYAYHMKTGCNIDDPHDMPLIRFPVRCADGRIEVELPT